MLSNAYFLAKFRFDTAENEPAKNLQNFAKFANFADSNPLTRGRDPVESWFPDSTAEVQLWRPALAATMVRDVVRPASGFGGCSSWL